MIQLLIMRLFHDTEVAKAYPEILGAAMKTRKERKNRTAYVCSIDIETPKSSTQFRTKAGHGYSSQWPLLQTSE